MKTDNLTSNSGSVFKSLLLCILSGFLMMSCSGDKADHAAVSQAATPKTATVADNGKGIGPVKEVSLGEIDAELVANGKAIFDGKCAACHRLTGQKIVGPGLADVTERRKPEWIMNMIINPTEMTQKDPTAKKLLAEHLTQMTNQNVSEEDARALLEYFRQNDAS